MFYKNYQNTRDLSWKILIQNKITILPVKVSDICRNHGIKIYSYDKAADYIKRIGQTEYCLSNDGFSHKGIIFFNDKTSIGRQRFTVAHELGHCLLHDGKGYYNREPSEADTPEEHEANIFASRLLAPACVLWGLKLHSAEEIAEICNVSQQSAEFRFKRYQQLLEREKLFLQTRGRSCFLLSPLERQVYLQFQNYIHSLKL